MTDDGDLSSRFNDPIWAWLMPALLGWLVGSFAAAWYGYVPAGPYGVLAAVVLLALKGSMWWLRARLAVRRERTSNAEREREVERDVLRARVLGKFDEFGDRT